MKRTQTYPLPSWRYLSEEPEMNCTVLFAYRTLSPCEEKKNSQQTHITPVKSQVPPPAHESLPPICPPSTALQAYSHS